MQKIFCPKWKLLIRLNWRMYDKSGIASLADSENRGPRVQNRLWLRWVRKWRLKFFGLKVTWIGNNKIILLLPIHVTLSLNLNFCFELLFAQITKLEEICDWLSRIDYVWSQVFFYCQSWQTQLWMPSWIMNDLFRASIAKLLWLNERP